MENDCWKNDTVNGSACDWSPDENSTTITPLSLSSIYSPTVSQYARAVLYWMIFIVGISGNCVVLAVVIWKLLKSPQHQTMTIFVGSLAVSDLGLLLWVTWINALLSVNPEWLFGKVTCQMYALWRSLTADCSIANLMIISVDRFVISLRINYTRGNKFCSVRSKNAVPFEYYNYLLVMQ